MPTNYASYYARTLSQAFPNVLHFGELYARKQEGDFRWLGAKTVEIPTLSVTGRVNSSRGTIGAKKARHSNEWKPFALRHSRKWDDLIHPREIDATNHALTIANITRVYNQEQKFPEMDKYTSSTLYKDWIALGHTADTTALTEENVLSVFDAQMQEMTEANVPEAGRVLYINPAVDTLMKNAKQLYRTMDTLRGDAAVQRAIGVLDKVKIKVVPSSLMMTDYDFDEGAEVAPDAQQIEMLLVHPGAIITPVGYEFAQLDEPSAGTDGHWVYFEESDEDVIILPKKDGGVRFVVKA